MIKYSITQLSILAVGCVMFCVAAVSSLPVRADNMPEYNPPAVSGAPTRRVGGGTRGLGDADPPVLTLLAPSSVGLTLQAQPTLYWSLSRDVEQPVEITVNYLDPMTYGFDPVLKTRLETVSAGIHALPFATHNVTLDPEIEYEITLALVMDEDKRLNDLITSATILRVEQVAALAGTETPSVAALASNGVWYDALANLSAAIATETEQQATLRQQRAYLLAQVGLLVQPAADMDIVILPPKEDTTS